MIWPEAEPMTFWPHVQHPNHYTTQEWYNDLCEKLQWCNPWPHVANRYCHCDVILIMTHLRRSQPPFSLRRHSHCDVIRYWAGHDHRYGRTYVTDVGHLTAFNI